VVAEERDFWDEHVPALDHCLKDYRAGPDANTAALLEALEPLRGQAVLDFGCGPGVLSAWLANRGAEVTGMDVSPRSIERARALCEAVGVEATFTVSGGDDLEPESFDRIAGRYVLHHVDVAAVAPLLGRALRPGGRAAFVETMGTNRLLPFLRTHLAGRCGIPRHGTVDEHPLTSGDLAVIGHALGGPVELRVANVVLFRLFDRQVLGFRSPRASRVLSSVDDGLHRVGRDRWSYHQVVTVAKPARPRTR
jgi:SAM-dependent methyltransferase